tara:strand:+ start:659 stop:787 length:129 start_codon:yes stop_codon:yes gene_type:complete
MGAALFAPGALLIGLEGIVFHAVLKWIAEKARSGYLIDWRSL